MDAEGHHNGTPCPRCGDEGTITYEYAEGFEELECPACGHVSDAAELDALTRYGGAVHELPAPDLPPIPRRSLKA